MLDLDQDGLSAPDASPRRPLGFAPLAAARVDDLVGDDDDGAERTTMMIDS